MLLCVRVCLGVWGLCDFKWIHLKHKPQRILKALCVATVEAEEAFGGELD